MFYTTEIEHFVHERDWHCMGRDAVHDRRLKRLTDARPWVALPSTTRSHPGSGSVDAR